MHIVLVLALVALGQSPDSATLSVRVTSVDDGTPLRRARVTVESGGRTSAPVFSDDEGRLVIETPRARYTIRASKAGYAPVDVAEPPQGAQSIAIRLPKAGVLRVQVVDATGQSSVGTGVLVRRLEPATGPAPSEFHLITDDRGEQRLGNLVAGRYSLQAYRGFDLPAFVDTPDSAARMLATRQEMTRRAPPLSEVVVVDVRAGDASPVTLVQNQPAVTLPYAEVGGVVTGVLLDEFAEPAEGVTVRLWQTRYTDGRLIMVPAAGSPRRADDTGRYRLFHVPTGRYLLVATPDPEPVTGSTKPSAFLPVYFPGRLDTAESAEIQVSRAQEAGGIDMSIPRTRGARVYGMALDSAGHPLEGNIMLVPSQLSGGLAPLAAARAATPAGDGSFEVNNVPPGTYALQAAATIRTGGGNMGTVTINGITQSVRVDPMHVEGVTEFAIARLTVGNADIGPLALTTGPTSTISGRIAVDGPGRVIAPADFGFAIANADPDEVPVVRGMMRPDVEVEPTGTFRISGLTGRSRIVLARAPVGWWLKSVDVGGFNAAVEPVNFGSPGDSRDDVTIVLSEGGATLAGKITGTRDEERFSVVVFPTDRALRISGSRYVRTTDPDSEGRFALNSFPPGQYFAIAVEEEDGDSAGDWESPEQLELLAPLAQRVTLGARETRTLDLPSVRMSR